MKFNANKSMLSMYKRAVSYRLAVKYIELVILEQQHIHYRINPYRISTYKNNRHNTAIARKLIHNLIGPKLYKGFINSIDKDREVYSIYIESKLNELNQQLAGNFHNLFNLEY